MDGIRRIARAYYERASEEEKNKAKNFFSKLDLNGDGKISLTEFKTLSSWLSDDEVFKKLDTNSDGALDFSDVLVLVYMVIKGRTFSRCNGCCELIFGPYFSCFLCLCKNPDQTYNLCCDCYRGGKFEHQHPFSNMLHDQALLAKFSQLTTNELKTQEKVINIADLDLLISFHFSLLNDSSLCFDIRIKIYISVHLERV